MDPILVGARQRRTVRRAVNVECQVVRPRDFKLLGARAVDVSYDGMLVETAAQVLTGEEVLVTFRGPRSDRWFDCTATVARVVHGRRPGDRGRCLGLEFEDLDEWTRLTLRSDLQGQPPPIPQRPDRIDYAESVRRICIR